MIKTQVELGHAKRRLLQLQQSLTYSIENLASKGLTESEIEDSNRELLANLTQIQQEISWFESAKQGRPITTCRIQEIGSLLISLRLAKGLSQKDLARLLKVSSAQVSKDEQQNYQGLSFERAIRILDALEARIQMNIVDPNNLEFHKTISRVVLAIDKNYNPNDVKTDFDSPNNQPVNEQIPFAAIQEQSQPLPEQKNGSMEEILTPKTKILVTVGIKTNQMPLGNYIQNAISKIEEKLLTPMQARKISSSQKFFAVDSEYEISIDLTVIGQQLETLNTQCQALATQEKCWARVALC